MPAREIDWTRTRRSLSNRIGIGNAIYSNTRQRILISPWFYPPEPLKEFFEIIGYQK